MTMQMQDVRTWPAPVTIPVGGGSMSRWFVEVGANLMGSPLLIFPHAGAGPTPYRRLANAMLGRFRPFVVHLPGRETRLDEAPCRSIPSLVQPLARAAAPLIGGRFVFYGHSMGALVAFELARQLRRVYGVEPDHLVVSGYAAPRVRRVEKRHRLADDDLWQSVCALLGTPPEVAADHQMRAVLLPTLRADFEACETYQYLPGSALDCPITSFAGTRDEEAPRSDMAGWAAETRSTCQQETVPGDHFFNLSDRDFTPRLLHAVG